MTVSELDRRLVPGALESLVRVWAKCRDVEVAADGRVWVCNPQRGHWLSGADCETFVDWLGAQNLDDAWWAIPKQSAV
jgi:hypothetical protein